MPATELVAETFVYFWVFAAIVGGILWVVEKVRKRDRD